MKTSVLNLAAFAATLWMVSFAQAQSISYKGVPICTYWSYTNGTYTCSSYPMTEYIPDRFSLDSKIRLLEQRIAQLEVKLQQIEASTPLQK